MMNEDQAVYARAFRRMWPERNEEYITIFPNGWECTKEWRRKQIRLNIGCQRRFRDGHKS